MSPTYAYAGLPLTPAVFADLALELVEPGTVIQRSELIDLVATEHAQRNGLPPRSTEMTVAKKALATLQEADHVEGAGVPGYWRFRLTARPGDADRTIEFGEGSQAVYVYYFPAYRELAAYRGDSTWPMKIGHTKSPAADVRIKDQCGTAMPERPTIGLIYRTNQATDGERLLHSTLKTRERHLGDAPGTEWFLTNLDEVKEILDFVIG